MWKVSLSLVFNLSSAERIILPHLRFISSITKLSGLVQLIMTFYLLMLSSFTTILQVKK